MIQSVGAAWLMTDLTTSHQLVALVQASSTTPIMLLGVFAGAVADNYDRRRVMLVAQCGMLAASALLAGLAWSGRLGPWSLIGFTLAVGCGTALNGPAWQASVRQQVGPGDLPQAISLNTIAFNLARNVGPALGGLLIAATSPAAAFGLNALSYVAPIAVLLGWRPAHPAQAARIRQPMLVSIATGLKFCAHQHPVRRVLVRGFVFGFGAAGYSALLPLVVRGQLNGTELDYGLILGAFGFGSILVALRVAPARRRFGSEAVVGAATLVFFGAMFAAASATNLAAALAAALVAGGGWVAVLTSLNVAMQLRAPEAILGRCLAIYRSVTFGGMALGAYALGVLADAAGVSSAIRASALLLLISAPLLRWLAPMPAPGDGRIAVDPGDIGSAT